MISGAANDSDPQRVWREGEEGLINRDNPKSVNLTSGEGNKSSGILPVDVGGNSKGLTVRRISNFSNCLGREETQLTL